MRNGKEIFRKFCKRWENDCKSRKGFSEHRKNQLKQCFDLYGGNKIPFAHFDHYSKETNSKIYPVVCAFYFGLVKEEGNYLVMAKSDEEPVMGKDE